jgi:hypothetical protein
MNDLPADIPAELRALLDEMTRDFPRVLNGNLVGIYVWGSLSYNAFDPRCSDADLIVVTRRDPSDEEFAALEKWFGAQLLKNPWTERLDMRFVIDGEFLDRRSRCLGFHFGRLVRHGSDANPFIWLNIGAGGITLFGNPAQEIAPAISSQILADALLLEIEYLKEDLAANAGDASDLAFFHNSYAVLTACRIYYTAKNNALVSKVAAADWTIKNVPPEWRDVIDTAQKNRLAGKGIKTAKLESDAMHFVHFIEREMKKYEV